MLCFLLLQFRSFTRKSFPAAKLASEVAIIGLREIREGQIDTNLQYYKLIKYVAYHDGQHYYIKYGALNILQNCP